MEKPSPITWHSSPKVEAWNYGYRRPVSAVRIRDDRPDYSLVPSRCDPHVNCLDFPPRPEVEDYSWVHSAAPVAKRLPPDHPLVTTHQTSHNDDRSPDAARGEERTGMISVPGVEIAEVSSRHDSRSAKSASWEKDNPNVSDFSTRVGKKATFSKVSDFGEVQRFTAHKAGGHYSSKTKSLLQITRKDEIDLQRQRDVAEAKAKLILSGKKLV